tara:strand:+ start:1212 stop:1922 length:711 start_codon:yes stop_codon:yes gene_type:complete
MMETMEAPSEEAAHKLNDGLASDPREESSPSQDPVDDGVDEAVLSDSEATQDGVDEKQAADHPEEESKEPPPPSAEQIIIARLRTELADRDEKLKTYITAYKQAMADLDREKERLARERSKVLNRERMELCTALLDVLDNLDRSRAGCQSAASAAELSQGLDMVSQQFLTALQSMGVKRMVTVGENFDHNLHEASGMIPAQGKQRDQEVIFEERAGYLFGEQLLRAARVVVATVSD